MLFLRILLPLLLLGPAPVPADNLRDLRLRLVEEINRDRKAAGLQRVEFSEELSRAADEHSREMLREDYISHWDRAGMKPYMRYALAGVRDYTEENIWSLWSSNLDNSPASLWRTIQAGHRSFMTERPPNDGHRRSILSSRHMRVGIGLAFDRHGLRLMEVFGDRYAELQPLPTRADLRDKLKVSGQILNKNLKMVGVAIFYEPLPHKMSHDDLRATYSYSLPDEVSMERPWLRDGQYVDGSEGSVYLGATGQFSLPLPFWKKSPGVYTIGVWLQEDRGRPFIGAMTSVFVDGKKEAYR